MIELDDDEEKDFDVDLTEELDGRYDELHEKNERNILFSEDLCSSSDSESNDLYEAVGLEAYKFVRARGITLAETVDSSEYIKISQLLLAGSPQYFEKSTKSCEPEVLIAHKFLRSKGITIGVDSNPLECLALARSLMSSE